MMHKAWKWVLPVALLGAAVAVAGEKVKTVWTGESGGFTLTWTSRDLTARSGKETTSLWSTLAKKGFEDYEAEMKKDTDSPTGCPYERTFRLLSVVGPIVSFEDQLYASCGGAHPSVERRFTAVDLSRSGALAYGGAPSGEPMDVAAAHRGRVAVLTDYFDERDVLEALRSDRLIRLALRNVPKTLADIPRLVGPEGIAVGECTYSVRDDFLTRFTFDHVEGDKVAVRLGLPPNVGACRTMHTQLGLLLPLPDKLKAALEAAQAGKQGFLLAEQKKRFGKAETKLAFETGKDASP